MMIKTLALGAIVMAGSVAVGQETFIGTVTDSSCATGEHAQMRMGPTDAECATACVLAHGDAYLLYDGTEGSRLSDQRAAEAFAGQRVRVTGRLEPDTGIIEVETIAASP